MNLTKQHNIRYIVVDGEEYTEKYSDIGHITNAKIRDQILENLGLGAGHRRDRACMSSKALGHLVKKLGAGGGLGSVKYKRQKIRRKVLDSKVREKTAFKKDELFTILHNLQAGG